MRYDLVLLHAPSVYDFRRTVQLTGPVADVIPSTSVFEMYPVGFTSMAGYLERYGYTVRIVNLANRMVVDPHFDVDKKIRRLKARAFGIDLHWMPHAHGSIEIARLVKRYHPQTPIIFGGLSATYFAEDLLRGYPAIDFVLRGDSIEPPLAQFIETLRQGQTDFAAIPNLAWRRGDDVILNPLSYVPETLDIVDVPDYRYTMRSVFKYGHFRDALPYRDWVQYPNTMVLTVRGCTQSCLLCGGSRAAYRLTSERQQVALRSPATLSRDIRFIQRFSRAPIFLIGDIRQGGADYVQALFAQLETMSLRNDLVFELFQAADDVFFHRLQEAVPRYSLEITLESSNPKTRQLNGKFVASNKQLLKTLQAALTHGCKKIDLFFMVGLPHQTYDDAMANVAFCEEIDQALGHDGRISYFIAPLAPFLDPGSAAFEEPERFGYRKLFTTFEAYRQALLEPSWKYTLNYETDAMTRDQIVQATYDSARQLNAFKFRCGLISASIYQGVDTKIDQAVQYMLAIDAIKKAPKEEQPGLLAAIKERIDAANAAEICGAQELRWQVRRNYAGPWSLLWAGFTLLVEELVRDGHHLGQRRGHREAAIARDIEAGRAVLRS